MGTTSDPIEQWANIGSEIQIQRRRSLEGHQGDLVAGAERGGNTAAKMFTVSYVGYRFKARTFLLRYKL